MKYRQLPQSEVAGLVASHILARLEQGQRVLWLLSGGSGGKVCLEASQMLVGHDLSCLYVTMSDERYGPLGHPDENFAQLTESGLSLPGATLYRPLDGSSREQATERFAEWLATTSANVDHRFAVLGIGEDGHAAGIKPSSPAVTSTALAASFDGEDFQRITVTPKFMRTLDAAIVQAYGAPKHAVIEQLLTGEDDVESFPASVIRDIPNVIVCSDKERT